MQNNEVFLHNRLPNFLPKQIPNNSLTLLPYPQHNEVFLPNHISNPIHNNTPTHSHFFPLSQNNEVFLPKGKVPHLCIVQRQKTRRIANYDRLRELAVDEGFGVFDIVFEELSPHQIVEFMRYCDGLVSVNFCQGNMILELTDLMEFPSLTALRAIAVAWGLLYLPRRTLLFPPFMWTAGCPVLVLRSGSGWLDSPLYMSGAFYQCLQKVLRT